MNSDEQELHEMIAEKRQLEAIALAADNAVLRQSLAIWERFRIYIGTRLDSDSDRVLSVFNGEPLGRGQVMDLMRERFPAMSKTTVQNTLTALADSGRLERSGARKRYRFSKCTT